MDNKWYERLREYRQQNKFTQKQVADYLGVDVSAYAHYEKGDRHPNADKLERMNALFKIEGGFFGEESTYDGVISYAERDKNDLRNALDKCIWKEGDSKYNMLQFEQLQKVAAPVIQARDEVINSLIEKVGSSGNEDLFIKARFDYEGELLLQRYWHEISKCAEMLQGSVESGE